MNTFSNRPSNLGRITASLTASRFRDFRSLQRYCYRCSHPGMWRRKALRPSETSGTTRPVGSHVTEGGNRQGSDSCLERNSQTRHVCDLYFQLWTLSSILVVRLSRWSTRSQAFQNQTCWKSSSAAAVWVDKCVVLFHVRTHMKGINPNPVYLFKMYVTKLSVIVTVLIAVLFLLRGLWNCRSSDIRYLRCTALSSYWARLFLYLSLYFAFHSYVLWSLSIFLSTWLV